MSSRRSRLKAVANLPVRRKPALPEQDGISASENASSAETSVEAEKPLPIIQEEKIQTVVSIEEIPTTVVTEKPNVENVNEKLKDDTTEKAKNDIKEKPKPSENIVGASRFGRRIKPLVCLPVKKDKYLPIQSQEPIPQSETDKKADNSDTCDRQLNLNTVTLGDVTNSPDIASPCDNLNIVQKLSENESLADLNKGQSVDNAPKKTVTNDVEISANSSTQLKNVTSQEPPVFAKPQTNVDKVIRKSNVGANEDPKRLVVLPQRIRTTSESSTGRGLAVQNVYHHPDENSKIITSSVKRKRPKCNDLTRKLADARREFQKRYEKNKPDRSSLKMIDLIFYNPSTNPMESRPKSEKKEGSIEEEDELLAEKVDDPDAPDNTMNKSNSDDYDDEDLTRMPVPQVKIGLNGEIILDEKSLVIETTEAKKGREDLQNSVPVFEDRGNKVSYYCRKTRKTKDWSDSETKRFYKSLNTIGTDFLLMQSLFPNRSRLELKNKFKREEKLNRNLVDKALNNPSEFDMTQLEKDLEMEKKAEEEENEQKLLKKTRAKKPEVKPRPRIKHSLLSREMPESDEESSDKKSNEEEVSLRRKRPEKEKLKKLNDTNMIWEKFLDGKANGETALDLDLEQSSENPGGNVEDNSAQLLSHSTSNVIVRNTEFKSRKRKLDEMVSDTEVPKDNVQNFTVTINNTIESLEKNGSSRIGFDSNQVHSLESEVPVTEEVVNNIANVLGTIENSEPPEVCKSSTKNLKRKNITEKKRKKKKRKKEIIIYTPDIEENESVSDNEDVEPETEEGVTTKTITDQDFFQLLALNVKNMKESTIKVQVTENYGENKEEPEKKIEVIFDSVPSITLKEIKDQNVTVLADFNTTVCESDEVTMRRTSPKFDRNLSPGSTVMEVNDCLSRSSSVIVENPNVIHKPEVVQGKSPFKQSEENGVVESENLMLVVNENDYGSTDYQYTMMEQEIEEPFTSEVAMNEEVETNWENDENDVEAQNTIVKTFDPNLQPLQDPAVVMCKSSQNNTNKMFLAGLSAGSFVLMSSESPTQRKEKKFSMFMISEKSQSDGTSVMSSMPVKLPPELVTSIAQELNCS